MRRWVFDLQQADLTLTKDNLQTGGSLQELRKRFSRHVVNTTGEVLENYLQLAQTHLEDLLHQSLVHEDGHFKNSDDKQEGDITAKRLHLNVPNPKPVQTNNSHGAGTSSGLTGGGENTPPLGQAITTQSVNPPPGIASSELTGEVNNTPPLGQAITSQTVNPLPGFASTELTGGGNNTSPLGQATDAGGEDNNIPRPPSRLPHRNEISMLAWNQNFKYTKKTRVP